MAGQNYHLSSKQIIWSLRFEWVQVPNIWESCIVVPRPCEEASVNSMLSVWKGRIVIPDVRKDRSGQCLSRWPRTNGSEPHGSVNRLVRPKKLKCCCNGLRCRRPSGMRPEAQLSDPISWNTCVYVRTVWEDIPHASAIYYLPSFGFWE